MLDLPLRRDAWNYALSRRGLLQASAAAGMSWLTPLAQILAEPAATRLGKDAPAQSLILIWLAGGASQLETFDPHPGKLISGGTKAVSTKVKGISLAEGLPRLAEQMDLFSLVRSTTSAEGDHERGTLMVKTGYRPQAPDSYPTLGAVLCHRLPDQCSDLPFKTDIPRHVTILPDGFNTGGGFLGAQYDPFRCYDPKSKVPDVEPRASEERTRERLKDLEQVEAAFRRRRMKQVEAARHAATVAEARTMMTSDQLKAFDIDLEPKALRDSYGDTPFGRACLAARRLTEVGARCVEVTLSGWDAHANNHGIHAERLKTFDPAVAALLADLKARSLLSRTVVLVMSEFGRTPKLNPLEGRDHWPHGFSVALAGGRIQGGRVIGETDPEGGKKVSNPVAVPRIHATVLAALGLDPAAENISPVQRPIRLADGEPLQELFG